MAEQLSDFTAALASEGFGKTTTAEGYTMNAAQRRKAYRKHPKAGETIILRGVPRLVLGPCTFNSYTGEERSKPSVSRVRVQMSGGSTAAPLVRKLTY
ncbi:hypothetical protein ACTVR5_15835 [Serratia marcescens]|uniref:hypothetical protein n=1 Tax=Serratia marcescens TaxID=615 RepID=UPI003FA6C96E